MPPFKTFFDICLDALFPVPQAERALLALGPERAFRELPRAERPPAAEACSIFSYKDERVVRLVWSIKYKRSAAGTAIAGYALGHVADMFSSAVPEILIVPMPITRRRRRERGFNQCELMTDEMARLSTGRGRTAFSKDLLLRVRHKSRQTLKDREERLKSADDIFAVNESAAARLDKRRLTLVVDDVVTTGSTMKSAVMTLRRAGFERVWGLSLAH